MKICLLFCELRVCKFMGVKHLDKNQKLSSSELGQTKPPKICITFCFNESHPSVLLK